MPALSQRQQKAAGMALVAKRGKVPMTKLKGAAKSMAKMKGSDLKEFAATKRGNLPMKLGKKRRMYSDGGVMYS